MIWLIALLAASVEAQTFTPPEGCEAFLTVQSRSCSVSHYYTCERDGDGFHWEVRMDADGPRSIHFRNDRFEWLRTIYIRSGTRQIQAENPADPASFQTLMEEGYDDYDFDLRRSDGSRSNFKGFDRLTGETVMIDGKPLQITEFRVTETGEGRRNTIFSGNQFASAKYGQFFGGIETIVQGDERMVQNNSPVELREPGEDGFLSSVPKYDCTGQLSALPNARRKS